jgi:alpha-glucosidase (family GH31 glycosyl hydrolase)
LIAVPVKGQNEPEANPVANPKAVIHPQKTIRFTVLTPNLIRMEWDSSGQFNDRASFVIVNRRLPVPKYNISKRKGWLIIKTQKLKLKYRLHSGKFNSNNVQINYFNAKGHAIKWKPGTVQKHNLRGTARTLDRYDGKVNKRNGDTLQLGKGLLSRDGWYFLDDSKSFLFDHSDWPWVMRRQDTTGQDWYFMGYGHHYKKALHTFSLVAGKIPLPPRYAFGYWWSRYWSYSDNEERNLIAHFRRYNIPLDVLVVDMDWHRTDSLYAKHVKDEFGQRKWWTGWTWDNRLFPDPGKFLQWTKRENLKVALNLHPASGIAPFDSHYAEFAKKMDFDTTTHRNIPYQGSNKKFMKTLFDVILHPMEKQGVDFWWLDWQQWKYDKDIKNLNNTWWINYVFFSDRKLHEPGRALIYHRWGGLGNHRYQVGFSGDTYISWRSLAYQPYFTNTASNVLYGYWSHDLGGHLPEPGMKKLDPELYTRWMQYGALSPIMRTHSTKSSILKKAIWRFKGDYFDALYNAVRLRYELVPYIYTMARKAYDSGISLCRPMYYDYPEKDKAYQFKREYMFGDDILVAPIGTPMKNGFSTVKVWLPEGTNWYEWATGNTLKGGQIVKRKFSIDEYPIYIKAGAIIPMYPKTVNNLEKDPGVVKLGIFPGGDYQARMYEDNGNDKQASYDTDYAYTKFSTKVRGDKSLKLTIHPREGNYKGMPKEKRYDITLYGSQMPQSVLIDGRQVDYKTSVSKGAMAWNYNGSDLSVHISIPKHACSEKVEVSVIYDPARQADINGLVEKFKRLTKATKKLKYKNAHILIPKRVGDLEEIDRQIDYHPKQFKELIDKFNEGYPKIPDSIEHLVKHHHLKKETADWYLQSLGFH